MSAVTGGGNYISDGQIMAWLAQQQDRIYGDLQHCIDLSGDRSKFIDDLNNIKAHLHDANSSQDHDFRAVNAEIQGFMENYGSDPEFADLCDGLKSMADKVQQDVHTAMVAAVVPHNVTASAYAMPNGASGAKSPIPAVNSSAGTTQTAPAQTAPTVQTQSFSMNGYDDNQMKEWDDLIGGKIDMANRNDQLTMIHIQELKATIDQSSQLGSTFISSGDKTSSAIINNIA